MFEPLRASLFAAWSRTVGGRAFYGWVVVAVTSLVIFGTGPGQSHLIGLFFEPMSRELGLSRTAIALAYGLATLFAALLLPRMGRLVDRYGPRRMLFIITIALGFSAIAFSFATGWLYLAVGFALLRFLAQGSLTLNCAYLVVQWFDRRRGFALGLMALGFPISVALHPPLVQWMIDTLGWRESWIWLGLSTWLLLLPPILLLVHNRPADLGLASDGDPHDAGDAGARLSGLTLAQALRTPAFYILAAGLFCLSMLVTALHVENRGILSAHGLDAQTAANMFAVTGITAAVLMPVVGRLLDLLPTKAMFVGGLLVMVASLVSATLVGGLASAAAYAMVFGLNNAVTMTYFSYMWPRYFGRRHLGAIQGTGQMIGVVGASLGPLPLSIAVDWLGGYDLMLRLLIAVPLVCAGIALFLKAPRLDAGEAPAA